MIPGLLVAFTGLSGAGKTTLARHLIRRVEEIWPDPIHLDFQSEALGRNQISVDANFSLSLHERRIRLLCEAGVVMAENGRCVVISFILPQRALRDSLRMMCHCALFCEIHVATPLSVCAKRDPKNLYSLSADGLSIGLPGLDVAYEEPAAAEVTIDTSEFGLEKAGVELLRRFDLWLSEKLDKNKSR